MEIPNLSLHHQYTDRIRLLCVPNIQSDQERLETRLALRQLIEVTKISKGAVTAGNQKLFEQLDDAHGDLPKKVLSPSEANLNLQELSLLSDITALVLKNAAANLNAVSADEFAARIQRRFSSGNCSNSDHGIDWVQLGQHHGSRVRSVRSSDFLSNLMQLEMRVAAKQVRKRRVREIDAPAETVTALETTATLQPTQTDGRIQQLTQILSSGDSIPVLRLCVNPHEYGQSVENLFDLSFLIGSGLAAIELDNNEVCVRMATDSSTGNVTAIQSILKMDYDLWQESIQVYGITESLIPHRP